MMDVMGVSEVLLCPYRYLEHIMVNSKNSQFNSACFYSQCLIILLPNRT